MKFESRTGIDWFRSGKTTCGASGPVTSGMAGSGGAARGVVPRSTPGCVAVGDDCDAGGPPARDDDGSGAGAGAGAVWHPPMMSKVASQ